MAGSVQSWPNWLWRNASRKAGGVVDLDEQHGRVGEDLLGRLGGPALGRQRATDRPGRASRSRARRRAARNGIRIAEDSVSTRTLNPPAHRRGDLARTPAAATLATRNSSGRATRPGTVRPGDPRRHAIGSDVAVRPSTDQGRPSDRGSGRRRSRRPASPRPASAPAGRAAAPGGPARRGGGGAGRGSGSRCSGSPCRTRTPRGCGGSP